MASDGHVEILKSGVETWNAWRKEQHELPDLQGADLRNANLRGAFFRDANLAAARLDGADLQGADLLNADLNGANLNGAYLFRANLLEANLLDANLNSANLEVANLVGANLNGAALFDANLLGANLNSAYLRANLQGANLEGANLRNAKLQHADLHGAVLGSTSLSSVDLSQAKGLESVRHRLPSTIGTDTLTKSQGKIPDAFLRGCGLADWEIEMAKLYHPALTRDERTLISYEVVNLQAESPIMLHHLFISYSHTDMRFVEKLEKGLDEKRIRYWRDVHDMKAGRLETQIDKAIRMNPIVVMVLSENSVESDWVEWEASKARELEKGEKRDVLCPIRLDDSCFTCDWPGPLRRQIMDYNILDFSKDAAFDEQFDKLVDGIVENYPPTGKP